MKVEIIHEEVKPVIPPVKEVVITLTAKEALILKVLMGHIAGVSGGHELSIFRDKIWESLSKDLPGIYSDKFKAVENECKNVKLAF
jgi:hypothetical protein